MQTASFIEITEDHLLGGRVRLCQPAAGYRAAIDPVMLAATVAAGAGDRVLDLGCGVGAAALCLLSRLPEVRVTGVELQPELARLARLNAEANGRGGSFAVIEGSVAALPAGLGGFDHVMTNPPFHQAERGTAPSGSIKATANVEGEVDLVQWLKAAVRMLRPKGQLAIIHRADRLADLLAALRGRGVGAIRILPLWPRVGRPAGRVIVLARKGSRAPLDLLPGLVLHGDDGGYTEAAEAVLRSAQGLAGP
ncbi:MAG: methyltransferase domain-containing protein [Magnetospirillum sp.]|nr:MAG: methyltransferase domain-containing protein [Magnetospirillum sp.]